MKKFSRIFALIIAVVIWVSPVTVYAADASAISDEKHTSASIFSDILDQYLGNHLGNRPRDEVLTSLIETLLTSHPELLEQVADALMDSGDKYSFYLTPKETAAFESMDVYGGIGLAAKAENGKISVLSVVPSSPAQIAGIEKGDIITAVDGRAVGGLSTGACAILTRGEKGTEVKVTVDRAGKELSFDLKRKEIPEPVVESKIIDENILYIKISTFESDDLLSQFVDAIQPFIEKRAVPDRVILDLRDNPGGDFYNMLDVINYFIPQKGVPIMTVENKDGKALGNFSSTGRGVRTENLCILVNGGSYSAAEATAFVLRENGLATVIGQTSGGKGVGQAGFDEKDGSTAYIISMLLKCNGKTYNGTGVIPDLEVKNTVKDVPFPKMNWFNHENYTQCVKGADNEVVLALSQRLKHMGYVTDETSVFNDTIETALAAYQLNWNIPVTGALDLATFEKITDQINRFKVKVYYNDEQLDAAIAAVKIDRNASK